VAGSGAGTWHTPTAGNEIALLRLKVPSRSVSSAFVVEVVGEHAEPLELVEIPLAADVLAGPGVLEPRQS
jgi:hypothetical protein